MGSALSSGLTDEFDVRVLRVFDAERYILLIHHRAPPRLHVVFKHGYTALDQLKAWVHAVEVSMMIRQESSRFERDPDVIQMAYVRVCEHFSPFVERLKERGWDINAGILVAGTPTVLAEWREVDVERKKDI
jgi:hypothetical protein